jgi:hypothetical protein
MISGRQVRRQCSANGKKYRAQLKTEESIASYYERCISLTKSIKKHGVVPMYSNEGVKPRAAYGDDKDIGVAIDEDGQLSHYRRGKHRLAIATALGIERVPVVVHFISGRYMLKFIRKRVVLLPRRLLAGIRKAVDQAVRPAPAPRLATVESIHISQ